MRNALRTMLIAGAVSFVVLVALDTVDVGRDALVFAGIVALSAWVGTHLRGAFARVPLREPDPAELQIDPYRPPDDREDRPQSPP